MKFTNALVVKLVDTKDLKANRLINEWGSYYRKMRKKL